MTAINENATFMAAIVPATGISASVLTVRWCQNLRSAAVLKASRSNVAEQFASNFGAASRSYVAAAGLRHSRAPQIQALPDGQCRVSLGKAEGVARRPR